MIVCSKCGRKFKSKIDVPMLFEIQNANDDFHTGIADAYVSREIDNDRSYFFRGCPNCLTDAYLEEKYRRGGHILSLDELIQQDLVYWHNEIEPKIWFMSWQIRMLADNIGPNGCIYYAIKNEELTIYQ